MRMWDSRQRQRCRACHRLSFPALTISWEDSQTVLAVGEPRNSILWGTLARMACCFLSAWQCRHMRYSDRVHRRRLFEPVRYTLLFAQIMIVLARSCDTLRPTLASPSHGLHAWLSRSVPNSMFPSRMATVLENNISRDRAERSFVPTGHGHIPTLINPRRRRVVHLVSGEVLVSTSAARTARCAL